MYYSFSVRSAGWNPQAVQLKILHHAPRFAGVLFFCSLSGGGSPGVVHVHRWRLCWRCFSLAGCAVAGSPIVGGVGWLVCPSGGCPFLRFLFALFRGFSFRVCSCMAWSFSGCLRLAVDALRDTPGGGSTAALLRRGSASSSRKIEKGHISNRFIC